MPRNILELRIFPRLARCASVAVCADETSESPGKEGSDAEAHPGPMKSESPHRRPKHQILKLLR